MAAPTPRSPAWPPTHQAGPFSTPKWVRFTRLSPDAKAASREFVSARLRQLLEGNTGRVIGGLRQTLTRRKLSKAAADTIRSTIAYFSNNRDRMHYHECLREGDPIASGVIEGACRHVVGNRLVRTGTHWTINGAVAMLATRTTYLSDDWHDYHQFRIKREQARLHPTTRT